MLSVLHNLVNSRDFSHLDWIRLGLADGSNHLEEVTAPLQISPVFYLSALFIQFTEVTVL